MVSSWHFNLPKSLCAAKKQCFAVAGRTVGSEPRVTVYKLVAIVATKITSSVFQFLMRSSRTSTPKGSNHHKGKRHRLEIVAGQPKFHLQFYMFCEILWIAGNTRKFLNSWYLVVQGITSLVQNRISCKGQYVSHNSVEFFDIWPYKNAPTFYFCAVASCVWWIDHSNVCFNCP